MNGEPVSAQLQVSIPAGVRGCPLVVLTNGFLLDAASYRSYATDLASWGYAVVLYDLGDVTDDVTAVLALTSIVDVCLRHPQLVGVVDPNCLLLAGHSRGGKLSCLLAATDPRVKGLALIDPVNNTSMTPSGPGYPSALPVLRAATLPPRSLPVLVVGAALNDDVIPAEGNYKRFVEACAGAVWELDLQGCGHLQFLDRQMALFSMFSANGPTPDATIRAVTKGAMLAWFERAVRPSPPPPGPQLLKVLEQECDAMRAKGAPLGWVLRDLDRLPQQQQQQQQQQQWAGQGPSGGPTNGGAAGQGPRQQQQQQQRAAAPNMAPVTQSLDELLRMRARELKSMLTERGIDTSDVFEKEELARRLLERCGPAGARAGSGW